MEGHADAVGNIAITDDREMIVSRSGDKTVRRQNTETTKQIGAPLKGHADSVTGVAISADEFILSSSQYKTLRMWSAQTGAQIGPPIKAEGRIQDVALCSDGSAIVAGLKLWPGKLSKIHLWRARIR